MIRLLVRQLWARRRRVASAGVAVVLGVAFLAATMMLGRATTTGIEALFVESHAGIDVQVRSSFDVPGEQAETVPVPADLLDTLASLPGVSRALPVVEGTAQLAGADGRPIGGNGPPTIGRNWADSPRNPYVLVAGRAPRSSGEVVIDADTADAGALTVGDLTTVYVPQPTEVTVVGIAQLGSGSSLGGLTFAFFDTTTAQQLMLGGTDVLSGVDLQASAGVSPEHLRDAVTASIPEGTTAYTGAELTDREMAAIESDFLGFFKTFLVVFAVIALVVAAFSIANTLSIVVAQRTRESALLRAVGASRRQVLATVTAEAAVVGALASIAGLGVGVGLAHGLNELLRAGGTGVPTAGLSPDVGVLVAGMATGTGVTLLAATFPAWRASRVVPLAALRDVAVDRSATSIPRATAGAAMSAAGVAAVVAAPHAGAAVVVAGLGAVATFVGVVLLGPLAASVAAHAIGTPVAVVRGTTGRLARGNAARNPRRTAGTASALMIGVAVVALFANVASSMKHSMTGLIERSFGGDLVVRPDGFSGAGLDPDLTRRIAALPEVARTAPLRDAPVTVDGGELWLIGSDVADLAAIVDLGEVDGDLRDMGADDVAVSTAWAEQEGYRLGDVVELRFADGEAAGLTIVATYTERDLMGDQLVDLTTLEAHQAVADDFLVMVDLADGVDLAAGQAAVRALTVPAGDPLVETSEEYLDAMGAELDAALALVYGLLGLAVVIALIGVANALSLSVHERSRELGLLRAVGQSRRAMRSTVRWEGVIVAVFGTLGGITFGTFACWGLVRAIATSEGFAEFHPSYTTIAVIAAVAVAAGLVAAWRPARRASRLDVLAAIAAD